MKFTKFTLTFFMGLLLFNCDNESTDNTDETEQEQNPYNGNFFPLSVDDTWNYDVENTDNSTNEVTESQDVLIIENESTTGFTLTVNQGGLANGTMSGVLTSGELTRTETTLATNGTIGLPIPDFDFEIQLDNMLLYNTEADNTEQLSTEAGTFTQDLNEFPVNINYTLTSIQLENFNNLMVNDVTYDFVTSSNITLELSIAVEVPIIGSLFLLNPQPVMSIDSFYAKNIGLVKAESTSGYTLNSATLSSLELIPGVDLSTIPTSSSFSNTQILTSYTVTE